MNILKAARIVVLALILFWSFVAIADVGIPNLTARVTDETATLTAEQRASLEQTLQAFEAKKGSQISVLIVPTTQPETIEQYSMRVVEQWKLGRKRVDDGALLIVAKSDRALRIEVGYGLEGALNDATSNRIINEIIVPKFRQGDFYGGIAAGVGGIMNVINGEPLPPPDTRAGSNSGKVGGYLPILFVLTMVAGGVLRSVLGRLGGSVVTGGAIAVVAWLLSGTLFVAIVAGAIALAFTLLGSGLGAYVGGRAIGGLGGGSGRTTFRGGGGGFGGGGASGRW
ncbi:lipoprotein [Caballeronia arationis]|uniref:TPM domain-containing protein n=1 Tax=Caballeronia arationis TaxID=1777142 RepID=UPI00074C0465|nr:TPM domain-containing protein [Caballeronia arationis]SAL02698.1 lipoprotein [Caballeronia arationis]